jgi:hypothetical protein
MMLYVLAKHGSMRCRGLGDSGFVAVQHAPERGSLAVDVIHVRAVGNPGVVPNVIGLSMNADQPEPQCRRISTLTEKDQR